MDLQPEELPSRGYQELDKLGHNDLIPFVRLYLGKKTAFTWIYYLANLLAFSGCVYLFMDGYRSESWKFGDRFTHFAYGLALTFTLLPLHEVLHALAYRLLGARQTSFAANLRKFYFMAIADKFVANRREFYVVALTPFIFISTGLIVLLFFAGPAWKISIAATLLAHTGMCSGDFGLLSYFAWHKNRDLVTYDDRKAGLSYFLAR